ncbi:peptide chain release factor N(5)-glutamine methyltransferase [Psychrobacter sp. 16-MNA-CIBAN-0192]|uniref:peptide chain release factor N(5)-glutamine methyltransferase n=1 Tax=Psychrobacter sp. 16-MNA-CIBAN-0192 TaxID=3140448 RepID=UPI00331FF04F
MTANNAAQMTVQNIKQQAKAIAENSAIPAFWITDWLLYVINKSALFLMTDPDYLLSAAEQEQFTAGITQMQHGMPLAYLTGTQAFWSLDFKVNEHTLIPRPDTEVLVEQVLDWIVSQPNDAILNTTASNNTAPKRLLDLGTGSGCIAISLAHELKHASWQVVAVDLSLEALKIAQSNAANNEVDVKFVHSSWYQALPIHEDELFDVIVSNPPYIDENDEHLQHLQAEPISALSAPNYGLADIEHIVQQAALYLRAGGLLAIEHGFDQGFAVRQLFLNNNFKAIKTVPDYGGNERVTLGCLATIDS